MYEHEFCRLEKTHSGYVRKWRLHPGQEQAYFSEARFTFIIAGFQSGKTSFAPLWLDKQVDLRGPGDYLAVTANYDLFKLKFLPEMLNYFEPLGWQFGKSDRVLTKKDHRIILRSAVAEGGLESATANAAILDECGQDGFSLEAFEAVQRRLALKCGPLLGATTPYNMGWLKQQIYDRWVAGDNDYRVIQFRSIDNPSFPVAEYERLRRTLPAWKFEMFCNGQFSRPAGLIYGDLHEDDIIEPFEIPAKWPRFVGVDFGAVNTAIVWLAYDPNHDTYYVAAESLQGDRATAEHVQSVKDHHLYQPQATGFGGSPSETQQRMDWADAGFALQLPHVVDVESGIDRIIALIRQRRLKVFKAARGIRDEFGRYSRVLDVGGEPTEKIANKEQFHRLDALRYAVCGLSSVKSAGLRVSRVDVY